MAYGVRRHRFNVDNLVTMVATGILDESAKIEHIDARSSTWDRTATHMFSVR
jgi:hypothetical protein